MRVLATVLNLIKLILKKISDDNHINLRDTWLYKHKTEVDMINQVITQINNPVIPLSNDIKQLRIVQLLSVRYTLYSAYGQDDDPIVPPN